MASYPKSWIARVKGALRAGLKPKQLAHFTGIPLETIKSWREEQARGHIEPVDIRDELRALLLKEN